MLAGSGLPNRPVTVNLLASPLSLPLWVFENVPLA
jgi:hypothetical protein